MITAGDILREKGGKLYSVSPDDTVYDALKIMADRNIGAVVVFDHERMVGLISERDYARKVILKGRHSKDTPVRHIMTRDVIIVDPEKKLEQCLKLIAEHGVFHLPVVENDRVVGILSVGDIVKGIIRHKEFIIEQLENYIKGWR